VVLVIRRVGLSGVSLSALPGLEGTGRLLVPASGLLTDSCLEAFFNNSTLLSIPIIEKPTGKLILAIWHAGHKVIVRANAMPLIAGVLSWMGLENSIIVGALAATKFAVNNKAPGNVLSGFINFTIGKLRVTVAVLGSGRNTHSVAV